MSSSRSLARWLQLSNGLWSCTFVLVLALACSLGGCGPGAYTAKVVAARNRLATAADDNARWYAPYELQMAESHLAKAEEEAAEASYEEAIRNARAAQAFAQKAIDLTRERRDTP